jgi:hypothetical protein
VLKSNIGSPYFFILLGAGTDAATGVDAVELGPVAPPLPRIYGFEAFNRLVPGTSGGLSLLKRPPPSLIAKNFLKVITKIFMENFSFLP